ncbi:MAG: VWA domain-containing protein [Candidatus Cloacimonetes bacterium]|nr:VWA domain-containing protein [Candidatus Cloacimonadota bacterium]
MLEYVNPQWFWALLLLIPVILYEIFVRPNKQVHLSHSRLDLLKQAAGYSNFLRFIPLILRVLAILFLVIALARPRLAHKQQHITGKGIDIMLAIDVSGSMKALDFKPVNRLEAAKKVARDFIDKRVNDRIGCVIFAENAFTQCPLTIDYNILMNIMDHIQINEEANGTSIGLGLATAVARLKDSPAKTKIIILITDGRNNSGEIDPSTAADLAVAYGIKVYPIGVGSRGLVDFPVQTAWGMQTKQVQIDIDMDALDAIAEATGTRHARLATNTDELEEIIQTIDKMEKTEIKIKNYFTYDELFPRYLLLALIFLALELGFRLFILKY